jgi:hypothetical protein
LPDQVQNDVPRDIVGLPLARLRVDVQVKRVPVNAAKDAFEFFDSAF